MHSRQSAFLALRRLALRGLRPTRNAQFWQKPVSRALSYRVTAPLWKAQTPDKALQTPQGSRQKSSHVPEAYEMTFTCKPCGERSTHRVSKQGYHSGSVLITCPECHSRHVISDNLKIFGDRSLTIEDLMREQGQFVKKGSLSEDGDLEFWSDGTTTQRAKPNPGDGASS